MTDLPIIKRLPWDSDFFGFPVARLRPCCVDTAVLNKALAWCDENGIRCLYYLAASDDPPSLAAAQAVGMQFVDVRLTLEQSLTNRQTWRPDPAVIRQAVPSDQAGLMALAPFLARVSRFGTDPQFGFEKAVRLYEEWLAKDTAVTFVAEIKTGIGGCITCNKAENAGTISLLVTHPDAQGQGLGQALCAAGLNWMVSQGCTAARVVTQGHNIASQRVYQRSGFLTQSVEIWFHKWFDINE
jgi:dTDP-4-amino-4,6-dideoxy-D-galactose acyltransferase